MTAFDSKPDDKRRSPRLMQEELACGLGVVLDLSQGGMRVVSRRKLTGEVEADLRTAAGSVNVKGRVAWCRKIGLRKYESGIEFFDVAPKVARIITAIAMYNRPKRTI